MDRLLISVLEMAEVLGIGRSAAYRLIHRSGFPVIKNGRKVMISVEGLKRWIREHEGEQLEA